MKKDNESKVANMLQHKQLLLYFGKERRKGERKEKGKGKEKLPSGAAV